MADLSELWTSLHLDQIEGSHDISLKHNTEKKEFFYFLQNKFKSFGN
jgi:hypothetical protein